MSRSKYKSISGVAGNTVLFKVLYCKIKSVFFIFVFVFYILFAWKVLQTSYSTVLYTWVLFWYLGSLGDFPGGSDGKESACNAGDPGLIPRTGRPPGAGNVNPLQHSCLDRGAWWTTVHGVAKSWTWLNDWYFHFQANFLYLTNKLDLHTMLLEQSPSICTELLVLYIQSIPQYSLHLLFPP